MDLLSRVNSILNKGLAFGAGLSLVLMVLVTVGEMLSRKFGKPIAGTVEIIGWLAAVTTAFALGYSQIYKGHVAIDLFVARLGRQTQIVASVLVYLISTGLFVVVTWNLFRYASVLRESGSLSETMKVIVYPWVYLVSFGSVGLTFALFVDFIKASSKVFIEDNDSNDPTLFKQEKGER